MPAFLLDVPYADKDEVKRLGARWSGRDKRWYAPTEAVRDACAQWAAKPDLPELLPGEDRSFGEGLFVDLVPSTCWFTNVRSCVSQGDWERLRRMVIKRAGGRCEICRVGEDREDQRWMEAHERWDFDEARGVQTLKRIICLCTDCHQTTHYGRTSIMGGGDWAFDFLREIRGFSETEANEHIRDAMDLWEARSQRVWELDLSILTDCDIELAPPPEAVARAKAAREALGGV